MLKGLRPVLMWFVVTIHEGVWETGSPNPRPLGFGIGRTVRTSSLRHVMSLNDGNCRLAMAVVKGCCARDALPQTFNIGVLKTDKKKSTKNKMCLRWICQLSWQLRYLFWCQWLVVFPINGVSDWFGWVSWHALDSVTHEIKWHRAFVAQLSPLLWENRRNFPPKSTLSCDEYSLDMRNQLSIPRTDLMFFKFVPCIYKCDASNMIQPRPTSNWWNDEQPLPTPMTMIYHTLNAICVAVNVQHIF